MFECCAEKTYAETTISDVVAGASISRTTFYKYFVDKRACFDTTVDACLEELSAVAFAAHEPGDCPTEAVAKATAAFLSRLAAKPAMAQLLAWEAVAVDPAVVEKYRERLIPPLTRLWSASDDGRMDPRLAFGRVQLLIAGEVAAGRAERLPELLPELVYMATAPFAGHEVAVEQAHRAGGRTESAAGR